MKLSSKSLFILAASAAALFAGCSKKPVRPDPSSTALGPQSGGGGALAPEPISTTADANSQLSTRDPNILEDANTIRGLLQPVYFAFDRGDARPGPSARDLFFHRLVPLREGRDLRQVSHAKHLLFPAEYLELMANSLSSTAANADIDFVEDQRTRRDQLVADIGSLWLAASLFHADL